MALYPWQHTLYQKITEAFSQNHGHHALLFRTEMGLGTDSLIHHFAHWLLCQNKNQQNSEPCHQCKSCLLFESENHPDFHLIQSVDNKVISVDEIRSLNEKLQQFAQQDGNIVIYIKDADKLNESSANALLKTLEEPHQQVYFLLKAPLQSTMLATIQSRCQQWIVHAPEQAESISWLQNQFPQANEEDLNTALRLTHHRPLFCKKFIESDRLSQRKQFLRNFWQFYKQKDVLLLLNEFDKEKEDALEQLDWLDSFFNDALKAKMDIATGWVNPDLQNGIIPFSQNLSAKKLLKGHKIIQQTQQDLKQINAVNQELMLLDCLTNLVLEVFE